MLSSLTFALFTVSSGFCVTTEAFDCSENITMWPNQGRILDIHTHAHTHAHTHTHTLSACFLISMYVCLYVYQVLPLQGLLWWAHQTRPSHLATTLHTRILLHQEFSHSLHIHHTQLQWTPPCPPMHPKGRCLTELQDLIHILIPWLQLDIQ